MAEEKSGSTTRTSTSVKTSDAVPEYKIFQAHYHGLTQLLFTTNLTPHLIQEGIITPADQEKLSAINTSTGKAEVVLLKITSGLEAGRTESFYKMINIMKSYGNHDAQQLSIDIECEITGSKSNKELMLDKGMDELSVQFSSLLADVADILHNLPPAILNKLKLVCYSITTTERSLLFSEKESAAIRASHSVFDIFYELRGHWRWDNTRLLFALIKRSGSQEALEKYEQFQKKINYSKKWKELNKHYRCVQKPLPSGYTRMIAIIEKDYSDFTVAECQELDEYLANALGSVALPPANVEESNSIKVTWYIPIEAVSGVLSKAYQAKELFKLLSISYFEIDEVIIWNEKWSLQVLTVQLSEKEPGYYSKLSQAEAQLREVIDEKDSLNEEVKTLQQKCASLQSALDKAEAEKLQMKPQAKGQKTESVHTIKMKYDELQVKLREKDIYVKHLKDQLNESEKKISKEEASVKTSELKKSDSVKSLNSEETAKQIEALQQALQKVKNENEILQKEKEKMQSEVDATSELSTQVEDLSKEVKQLKGINSLLRKESEDLKVQNTELRKKEKQPQSQEDTSKLHLEDSELSSQVDELNKEVMELRGINSLLRIENDDLKKREQQNREALQAQTKSLQEQLKKSVQSQEDTSKLHLKNSELLSQIEELNKEVMELKGINSLMRTESEDLKEQITKLQQKEQQTQERLQAQIKSLQEQPKKPHQAITQVPKAESDSKAIIDELNDQVESYIGLLDERDDIIKKLQAENKRLKEEKEQAKKVPTYIHQVEEVQQAMKRQAESKQLKEEVEQVVKRRVHSKEEKETKQQRRASMYVKLPSAEPSELEKWLQKRRERTDKDDQ